jgi:hypothetical protein
MTGFIYVTIQMYTKNNTNVLLIKTAYDFVLAVIKQRRRYKFIFLKIESYNYTVLVYCSREYTILI